MFSNKRLKQRFWIHQPSSNTRNDSSSVVVVVVAMAVRVMVTPTILTEKVMMDVVVATVMVRKRMANNVSLKDKKISLL